MGGNGLLFLLGLLVLLLGVLGLLAELFPNLKVDSRTLTVNLPETLDRLLVDEPEKAEQAEHSAEQQPDKRQD